MTRMHLISFFFLWVLRSPQKYQPDGILFRFELAHPLRAGSGRIWCQDQGYKVQTLSKYVQVLYTIELVDLGSTIGTYTVMVLGDIAVSCTSTHRSPQAVDSS